MALKLNSIRADLKRENDGDWVAIPLWDGVKMKVRADTYPPYRAARDSLLMKMARKHHGAEMPEDEVYATTGALLAEHILLDWSGIVGDDESPISFDAEKAKDMLTDPAWREFRGAVEGASARLRSVTAEFVESATKN